MLIIFDSIVAVHGLGADPKWTWIANEGGVKEVNWLADLLPKELSDAGIKARIMTFGYESQWHKHPPKTRRTICSEELLAALSNERKQVRII